MLELPAPCHWLDADDGSYLHWHASCIAIVRPDGSLTIRWWSEIHGKAASLAQGKRYVERWVSARRGLPPGKRARAMRESRAAGTHLRPEVDLPAFNEPPRPILRMPRPPRR